MDNVSDSSFQRLGSSFCHVCEGFGDMQNPRGALVEAPEGRRGLGRYFYTYMHHPSVAALVRSAEAGCNICAVICYEMRFNNRARFDEAAAMLSAALTTASTHSEWIMNTRQSDDDTSAATQLAKCAESRDHLKDLDLGDAGNGRIVIEHSSHDKPGPWGTADKFTVKAYAFNVKFVYAYLSGFQTSCRSISQDYKMGSVRDS